MFGYNLPKQNSSLVSLIFMSIVNFKVELSFHTHSPISFKAMADNLCETFALCDGEGNKMDINNVMYRGLRMF